MKTDFKHFAVIGAGAWGSALAVAMLRARRSVTLWARRAEVADAINSQHTNPRLSNIPFDKTLRATASMADIAGADAFIIATPAQHMREVLLALSAAGIAKTAPLIITAKGIEQDTNNLLSEVVKSVFPDNPVAVLSGPSFATEVARSLPTALTLAVLDAGLAESLAAAMATPTFRLYITDDVTGAQIGGAIKNVLAIACGIIEGRQMGENARAALVARGLSELSRLGLAMGARLETLMGLSGMGDVVLTCSSPQSRNMALGIALGQGKSLQEILAARTTVSEGVSTAKAALALAKKYKVEMPIVAAVDAVINNGASIDKVVAELLSRPLKSEGL